MTSIIGSTMLVSKSFEMDQISSAVVKSISSGETASSGGIHPSVLIFLIIVAVLFLSFIRFVARSAATEKEVNSRVTKDLEAAGFVSSMRSLVKGKMLAIDRDNRRIAIHTGGLKDETRIFDADKIISVAVHEGGHVIGEKTSVDISILGTPRINRGLQSNVKEISVRLELNDVSLPIYDHKILDVEVKKDGWIYNSDMEKARSISSQITSLMRNAPDLATVAKPDVAAQFSKLAELRASGALSEEEFSEAKKHVLDRDVK